MIYDSEKLNNIARISGLNHMPAFEFTPDNRFVFGGHYAKVVPAANRYEEGVIDFYDARSGNLRKRFDRFQSVYELEEENIRITTVPKVDLGARSANGRHEVRLKWQNLGDGSRRKYQTEVALLGLDNGVEITFYKDNTGREVGPTCSAFSPDGKFFAVGRSGASVIRPDEPPGPFSGDVLLFTVPE